MEDRRNLTETYFSFSFPGFYSVRNSFMPSVYPEETYIWRRRLQVDVETVAAGGSQWARGGRVVNRRCRSIPGGVWFASPNRLQRLRNGLIGIVLAHGCSSYCVRPVCSGWETLSESVLLSLFQWSFQGRPCYLGRRTLTGHLLA